MDEWGPEDRWGLRPRGAHNAKANMKKSTSEAAGKGEAKRRKEKLESA